MDMITDVGVINKYRASGNTFGANSLIAMIGSSLAAQLLWMYGYNIKSSTSEKVRLFVTFLKPGVDASRVATGYEEKDSTASPRRL